MAGILDFLTQGTTPPQSTSSTTSTSSLPQWYNQYLNASANEAATLASQPYPQYTGPRIAPVNPQQTQAFDFLGSNATNWQQPLSTGTGALTQATQGFDPTQFNQYLSPYTSGVTSEIQRLGQQNLDENLLPDLNSQFVGSGGFGSQRNMDMDERLVRDVGANISGQQALANQGAVSSAMSNYLTGQGQGITAAGGLTNAATANSQLTTGTAGALEASGATQRSMDQSNLDLAYQDFLNQQNYPYQQTQFMTSVLNGASLPTTSSSSTTAPFQGSMSPSPLAQFAGIYGLANGMTAKRGGSVKRMAVGGLSRIMTNRGMPPRSNVMPMPMRPRVAPLSMGMARPMMRAPLSMMGGA